MAKSSQYYQFHKNHKYSIYVKFEDIELEKKTLTVLSSLGFENVDSAQFSNLEIISDTTKILRISYASPQFLPQIDMGMAMGLDKYGAESLTPNRLGEVYRHKGVGLLLMPTHAVLWDLLLKTEFSSEKLLLILTRFLAYSLVGQGIFGLWGVPVDEGVVVMRGHKGQYESILVDIDRGVMITKDGDKELMSGTKIIRLDDGINQHQKMMRKEELISFLSTHTTFFSYKGLSQNIKVNLFELMNMADGIIYPEDNFLHRSNLPNP